MNNFITDDNFVSVNGVSKSFNNLQILKDVSLTTSSSMVTALVGPSGCGKTTLLRIICGLERQDHGSIIFGQNDVTNLPPSERNIGFVFQNYCLWPHMTVYENIEFGLLYGKSNKEIYLSRKDEIAKILELVNLSGISNRFPHQISGGQQQRVAIARSLILRPKVLLLDEPMSNLDKDNRRSIAFEILGITDKFKIATILVSHDIEDVSQMASQIVRIEAGSIIDKEYRRPTSSYEKE